MCVWGIIIITIFLRKKPQTLWGPKLWLCSLCALGVGLCPGHVRNWVAAAVVLSSWGSQGTCLLGPSLWSPEPAASFTRGFYWADHRDARLSHLKSVFCRQGPQVLWLGPLSRPGPWLGSLACRLPGCL